MAAKCVRSQGSPQDLRDVLRRAHAGVICRDPGRSLGGITYRHYARPARLAFRAILSLAQPFGVQNTRPRSRGAVFLLPAKLLPGRGLIDKL
jgi:hypothetical protein